MTTETETVDPLDMEQPKLLAWRSLCLERAGYDPECVTILAGLQEVNLHQACEILNHGCSQDVALRILT